MIELRKKCIHLKLNWQRKNENRNQKPETTNCKQLITKKKQFFVQQDETNNEKKII